MWGRAGIRRRVAFGASRRTFAFAALLGVIALVLGRGLMRSTVSFEATDAFDAVVRGSDYVLRRPLYLLFAIVAGAVYFVICFSVLLALIATAFLVAAATIWCGVGEMFTSVYGILFSAGAETAPTDAALAYLMTAIIVILGYIALAWAVAYIESFWAVLYALIRKQVDLCEHTEIFLETGTGVPPAGQQT